MGSEFTIVTPFLPLLDAVCASSPQAMTADKIYVRSSPHLPVIRFLYAFWIVFAVPHIHRHNPWAHAM